MPQYSPRQKLLFKLKQIIEFQLVSTPNPSSSRTLHDLVGFYLMVKGERYLQRWRPEDQVRDRSLTRAVTKHMQLGDRDFRSVFRMSKSTFTSILHSIGHLSHFHNATGRHQAEPIAQLAVALYRFTHHGDGASVGAVALQFGTNGESFNPSCPVCIHRSIPVLTIIEGCVVAYTTRVMLAILQIGHDVLYWPDADERVQIAARFAREGALGGCVGIIDGFHVVLAGKPHRADGNDFWNRKERFSFNIQGICDDQKRIRSIHTGFPGRSHDARVYSSSGIVIHPQKHFSAHEYLLADSAYPPGPHCIPMFKREQGAFRHGTTEFAFNTAMAKVRVKVEHSFGMLKCRFSSLRYLAIAIRNDRDEFKASAWIRACVILHNLMRPGVNDIPMDDMLDVGCAEYEEPSGRNTMVARLSPRRVALMDQMGLPRPDSD